MTDRLCEPARSRQDTQVRKMTGKYVSNDNVSVRMFKSGFFESLSHVHPAVPHLIFIPVIVFMLYASFTRGVGAGTIVLLTAGGVLLWTFTEYMVHRFVFHTTPDVEEAVRNAVAQCGPGEPVFPRLTTVKQKHYFLAHGVHHDFPNDSRRLVMPPSVSIPLAVLFYAAFRLVLGPVYCSAPFAGFVLGYLAYDTIHYAVHHFTLTGQLSNYLKKLHLRHHYQDNELDFGVSSPLWDYIMGTASRRNR